MMKSVLISIRPEWAEMIVSRKKTIELRKNRPNLETPFRCYIYCTKRKSKDNWGEVYGGFVIGEFTCDRIISMSASYKSIERAARGFSFYEGTRLTDKQIIDYLGNGTVGYGWHISNLKVYDKPKILSMFYKECAGLDNTGMCWECEKAVGEECDCAVNGRLHITRPPQSWCYVEEL